MKETQSPKTIAEQLQNFHPIKVGDPVGTMRDTYFFPESTPRLWGGTTFCLTLILVVFIWTTTAKATSITRKFWRGIKATSVVIFLTGFAAALGMAAHVYWGGPFNYNNYRVPKRSADVVIWFTGADDGTFAELYTQGNVQRSYRQFGRHRAALFSFADVDHALAYARKTPPKTRFLVRGHSMGGAAAVAFAEHSPRQILLLDTRDPTSWFNRKHAKPAHVVTWRNLTPEVVDFLPPEEQHPGTNYIGPFNMANVFRFLGRAWPEQQGALNIHKKCDDHHSIGNNLPEDPRGW